MDDEDTVSPGKLIAASQNDQIKRSHLVDLISRQDWVSPFLIKIMKHYLMTVNLAEIKNFVCNCMIEAAFLNMTQ